MGAKRGAREIIYQMDLPCLFLTVAFKETVQDVFLYSGLFHSLWPLHISTYAHT